MWFIVLLFIVKNHFSGCQLGDTEANSLSLALNVNLSITELDLALSCFFELFFDNFHQLCHIQWKIVLVIQEHHHFQRH